MKLLLDEMLAPAIARELQARGHDVEAVAGHPDREALSDPKYWHSRALSIERSLQTMCGTSAHRTTTRSSPASPATSA